MYHATLNKTLRYIDMFTVHMSMLYGIYMLLVHHIYFYMAMFIVLYMATIYWIYHKKNIMYHASLHIVGNIAIMLCIEACYLVDHCQTCYKKMI